MFPFVGSGCSRAHRRHVQHEAGLGVCPEFLPKQHAPRFSKCIRPYASFIYKRSIIWFSNVLLTDQQRRLYDQPKRADRGGPGKKLCHKHTR